MTEPDQNISDDLVDAVFAIASPKYDGQCEHPDCQNQGSKYDYPSEVGEKHLPYVIACPVHIKYFGFCYRCGEYARGEHNFDWCDGRLCDPCMSALNSEMYSQIENNLGSDEY